MRSKIIIQTGDVFGRLTAVKPLPDRSAHGELIWEFRCSRGTVGQWRAYRVVGGHTKSCGCLNLDNLLKRSKYIPRPGDVFGRLTVLWVI
jgi:hypothetical protein